MEVPLAWVSKTSVVIAESTAVSKQKVTRDHLGTRAPALPSPALAHILLNRVSQTYPAPYPSLHNAHKIHPAAQNKEKAESPSLNSPRSRAGRPLGRTGALAFATTGSKQKKTAVSLWHKTAKAETTKPPKNFKSPSQDIPEEKK